MILTPPIPTSTITTTPLGHIPTSTATPMHMSIHILFLKIPTITAILVLEELIPILI